MKDSVTTKPEERCPHCGYTKMDAVTGVELMTTQTTPEKHRASYLGVSETYVLNASVIPVDAVLSDFGYGTYMVGSCLTKKDYRDVDLRFIMKDEEFDRLFIKQRSGLHLLFNVAISEWLQRRTNLPIDFQVQRQTDCNEEFKGQPRNAMGMIEGVNIK